MSSVNTSRGAMLEALGRALGRRFSARVVMYHQAVAERLGLSVTDLKCLDLVADAEAPVTAGQLAELSGLTTGAITGVLDRLEHAGFVQRETDPQDRRRVVIRPQPTRSAEVDAFFEPLTRAQEELFTRYSDEQIALLLDYVSRSTTMLRDETARLRNMAVEPASPAADLTAAPLGSASRGRLAFHGGMGRVTIHGGAPEGELYHARFDGRPPLVRVQDGTVTMRYRGLGLLDWRTKDADIGLNESIPWSVDVRGGASMIDVDLRTLAVEALAVSAGGSEINVWLPRPAGLVPVRASGAGSSIQIRRPAGTAARARLRGGGSSLMLDGQYVGGGAWVTSSPPGPTDDLFEIEASGIGSGITVECVGA